MKLIVHQTNKCEQPQSLKISQLTWVVALEALCVSEAGPGGGGGHQRAQDEQLHDGGDSVPLDAPPWPFMRLLFLFRLTVGLTCVPVLLFGSVSSLSVFSLDRRPVPRLSLLRSVGSFLWRRSSLLQAVSLAK